MARDKLLIVDDELFFREVLKEDLRDRFEIIEGKNGNEAVDLAITHAPALILLDIEMPSKNGIDACRILKNDSRTRRIPIILLASRHNKQNMVLGLKAGADDYMTKPVYIPGLIARINAHLRSTDFYSDLEKKDLCFLLEISERISAIRNPMKILTLIVEKISEIIDVARCSIVSVNDKGDAVVKASSDFTTQEELELDLIKYPEIRRSLQLKQTIIINDVETDPLLEPVRAETRGLEFHSIIVVPIVKKESVIGTLLLRTASRPKDGITSRIHKICQLIADISANALENAVLFESVQAAQEYFEDIAIRDGLTNLYNHRHFYSRLEEEFNRARRYRLPLSLVFFDIDNFKQINDRYGHPVGDKVLNQIGTLLKHVARESDIAARYGGEEFAIILPNTGQRGALDVAQRIHIAVRNHIFSNLSQERITISAGVATFDNNNMTSFQELVQLADAEIYTAKRHGKDRVCQKI